MDKRALQPLLVTAGIATGVIGTLVPANMRRYIYRIKTNNQFAGANQLRLGYSPLVVAITDLDYIDHVLQHDMWLDPEVLLDDAAPIYIVPAGNYIYVITDAGDCYVHFLYEDSE